MWKFIIGCVTISTRKIMRWLENVVGLFLMNPDRFRFQFGKIKYQIIIRHLENIYPDAFFNAKKWVNELWQITKLVISEIIK